MWQVTGQKRAVSLFQRSLETGGVSHAYLFTGPAHSGKMNLARELAKAVNCTGTDAPCGVCDSCRKIDDLKHADVRIIGLNSNDTAEDAKSKTEISIDQIRQIQHSANLPPFEGKYKVFIIENAELMSTEAANSLLKTLEEPEAKVIFILLAVDAKQLLETVVSRCQPVEMVPVPFREIEDALVSKHGLEPERAALLARLSRGWFGWAVTAADDADLMERRDEMLDRVIEVMEADCETRFAWSAQVAGKFAGDRQYVYERLDLWLDWWRDMLMIKAGLIDNVTNINRLDELKEAAEPRTLFQIRQFISSLQSAEAQLRQNANPRLVLDVLMLDVPAAANRKETAVSDSR